MGTVYKDKPLDELLRRAEAGDAQALARLGHVYTTGDSELGVAPDRKTAALYYTRGAERGDMASTFGLAGLILPDDPGRSVELLETAAANDYIWALATLGDFYLRGRHVEQNPQKAAAYLARYNELCRPGKVPLDTFKVRWDLVLYPLCLLLGVGVEKNEQKARTLLTELAAQGNLNAADILRTGKLSDWMTGKRFNFDTKQGGPVMLFDAGAQQRQHRAPQVHSKPVRETIHHQHLSPFLRRALIPDEEVLMRGVFPWVYTFFSFFWLFAFILLGRSINHFIATQPDTIYKILPIMTAYNWLYTHPRAPAILCGGLGFLIFVRRAIEQCTTEIILTNTRFLYKRGLFSIKMLQMNFWRIEHSNVTQSMIGGWFDYGVVQIQSDAIQSHEAKGAAGPGVLSLPHIRHPYLFSRLIEDNRQLPFKQRSGRNSNNDFIPMGVRP